MPEFLTAAEFEIVAAAAERLIPAVAAHPGARRGGAATYIDGLLGAFSVDPPRVFAGGPFSGRAGGDAAFTRFMPLGRLEELAWRTRIEGSCGVPERELNGPVVGLQERYRDGIRSLGADFAALDGPEQDRRLAAVGDFESLLYEHSCEGLYSAPEYGGNPNAAVWLAIEFPGDSQPRGYTDQEVSGRA